MKQGVKQESGLAHIGLIVAAILVVAALAFAGWWVWERNQKEDTNSTSQSSQSQEQKEEKTNDPSEGGKYLVIAEWDVRFPLPEELRGDVYYKVGSNSITKLEKVSFASTKLDKTLGNFSCSFKENPQIDGLSAGLLRLSAQNKPGSSYITSNLNLVKEDLNGYEYFTSKQATPSVTCLTGQHEEFNDIEQSISNQLKEAFTKLETLK